MNRAVYLLRPDKETHDDLRRTAIELVTEGPHNQGLIAELPKITNAYIQLVEKERKTPMYMRNYRPLRYSRNSARRQVLRVGRK